LIGALDRLTKHTYIGCMDRETVISTIRHHEDELRAAGVTGLSLFGSVARDEATETSDIDVAVLLEDRILESGLTYFRVVGELKERLEEITGRPVDVVTEPIGRTRLAQEIERDRKVAF